MEAISSSVPIGKFTLYSELNSPITSFLAIAYIVSVAWSYATALTCLPGFTPVYIGIIVFGSIAKKPAPAIVFP